MHIIYIIIGSDKRTFFFRILILIKKTYGCYSENEKHIIFVCKDEEIPWKESEESKKASTENLETQSESSAK